MKNKFKSYLSNKSGMTLVEVLTAGTILMLILFCFSPLIASYSQTVTIAGGNLTEVQNKSGIMESILGAESAGNTVTSYNFSVSEVPVKFSATSTQIALKNSNGQEGVISASGSGGKLGMVQLASNTDQFYSSIGSISGTMLTTNDGANSYSTINARGASSSLSYFPKTLTDDFITANVVLVGDGVTFSNNYAKDVTLYVSSVASANKLAEGTDYAISKPQAVNNMIILTIFGGSKVSFENSPLIVYYEGREYKIEVDAPSMIMVGEADANDDDSYHYYVSRGELVDSDTTDSDDSKDTLAIIQRDMNSTDAHTGNKVTLTSAMNDVEWVSAEDADSDAVDENGNKYGYYVMCGDNGQIRRFWRNNTTGNYYWGGDNTLYTDISYDQKESDYHVLTEKKYSTNVSYKFTTRRAVGADGEKVDPATRGFNVAHRRGFAGVNFGMLRSCNVWTYNAFDADSYYYAPDGILVYHKYKSKDEEALKSFDDLISTINADKSNRRDERKIWNGGSDSPYDYDMAWLQGGGVSDEASSAGITLTSVGAIRLTGCGGAGYETNARNGSHELYFDYAQLSETSKYPTETYVLYAGYIPAAMDLWATKGWGEKDFNKGVSGCSWGDGDNKNTVSSAPGYNSLYKRASYGFSSSNSDNAKSAINDLWSYWKGNYGLEVQLTSGDEINVSQSGLRVYHLQYTYALFSKYHKQLDFYPFTNVQYVLTGKYDDTSDDEVNLNRGLISNIANNKQMYSTNGEEIDVTIGYLSTPFAVHFAANPIDSKNFPVSNDKTAGNHISYWNNRKETVTFLDIASTAIPNGVEDIPVSLAVGYVMGGIVEYEGIGSGDNLYSNAFLDNGIVYLRAGTADIGVKQYDNIHSEEYSAIDSTGYKLDTESNYFHQFYYLNSKINEFKNAGDLTAGGDEYQAGGVPNTTEAHPGDMYGAKYWQNNRHISYVSVEGSEPDTPHNKNNPTHNYLRCHPMSDAKVTCVAWGTTWNSNPEAMWGTDNGTVLSWWVDLNKAKTDDESKWNDKSVSAEFQSYQWIDNCTGKSFACNSSAPKGKKNYVETIGAHWGEKNNWTAQSFDYKTSGKVIHEAFRTFYDKGSRVLGQWQNIGFVSTLSTINDVEFANDNWIAVGDQAAGSKNIYGVEISPALYCANGKMEYGGRTVQAYTGDGTGGSWVNVRYWVDAENSGGQSETNSNYLWKAVQISKTENYNIVQINNVNGIWIATGYYDANDNDEFDNGERTVVCWTRDPLKPCTESGGWSEKVTFYDGGTRDGDSLKVISQSSIGGINSCATRS